MKKITTLLTMFFVLFLFKSEAQTILNEGFETGNTDLQAPTGLIVDNNSWLCGYQLQSHGREAHSGDWYAYLPYNHTNFMYKQVELLLGETYEFMAWYKTDGIAPFDFRIAYGNSPSPTSMNYNIFPVTSVENNIYEQILISFQSEIQGVAYIGFYASSNNSPWYICIDDISLRQIVNFDFTLETQTDNNLAYAGNCVDYLLTINNIGTSNDTYQLSVANNSWEVVFLDEITSNQITEIDVNTLESANFIARVCLPASGVSYGEIDVAQISATSVGNNNQQKTIAIQTTALIPIAEFPYIEGFEQETFPSLGWQAFVINNEGPNFSRVSTGEWPTCLPHDNSTAMLKYASFSATAGKSAVLITPQLAFSETGNQLRFWIYRTNNIDNKADKIEIYINSVPQLIDAQLLGTIHRAINFEPVETENGWFEYVFEFDSPANSYIIFKAISDYGWNMYIDDIKINNTTIDTEAPVFQSLEGTHQYADLEMRLSLTVRDESEVLNEIQGVAYINEEIMNFAMTLTKVEKGNFYYTGVLSAQQNHTFATVKFQLADIHGNTQWTENYDIRWENIAPIFEEGFESETFPPEGWGRISQPYTWFIWSQAGTVDYLDSDGISYTVSPPQGLKQACVEWDFQNNNQNEWLITPPINIIEQAALRFKTHVRYGSIDYDMFPVKVSTDGGNNWTEIWNASDFPAGVNEYSEDIEIPLDNFIGNNIKIAWQAYNLMYDNIWYSWFIDDVKVIRTDTLFVDIQDITTANSATASPNPFVEKTTIKFNLAENSDVKFVIFDSRGVIIEEKYLGNRAAGINYYEYTAKNINSGMYFYKIETDKKVFSGKLLKL